MTSSTYTHIIIPVPPERIREGIAILGKLIAAAM